MSTHTDTDGSKAAENWGLCAGFALGASLTGALAALVVAGYYPTLDWPIAFSTTERFIGQSISMGVIALLLVMFDDEIRELASQ